MLIYDYEVFQNNTLLGTLDTDTYKIVQLWDLAEIKQYIKNHLEDIWIRFQQ